MAIKDRQLLVMKYLLDRTDENHPVSTNQLLAYLEANGVHADRKTIATDAKELAELGLDVVCNRKQHNEYFIGSRQLELPELKLIVDAVQSAMFLSERKSREIINRVTDLASPYQAEQLKRRLYVQGKPKTTNQAVIYSIDTIHTAINGRNAIEFKYYEYTAKKRKRLKHKGMVYHVSPYDLLWNHDCYYLIGWCDEAEKILIFRVDRMQTPELSEVPYHRRPNDYSIEDYSNQTFLMSGGENVKVSLLCDEVVMNSIVDRFGEDIETETQAGGKVIAKVKVSPGSTFYGWVFASDGAVQIVAPEDVKEEYLRMLRIALKLEEGEMQDETNCK